MERSANVCRADGVSSVDVIVHIGVDFRSLFHAISIQAASAYIKECFLILT